MSGWAVVLSASAGCYALKYAGLAAPRRLLDRRRVGRFVEFVPVALLAALVVVQAFASGRALVLDARAAGLAAAALAVVLRAPFIAVVLAAAVTAGLVRVLMS